MKTVLKTLKDDWEDYRKTLSQCLSEVEYIKIKFGIHSPEYRIGHENFMRVQGACTALRDTFCKIEALLRRNGASVRKEKRPQPLGRNRKVDWRKQNA